MQFSQIASVLAFAATSVVAQDASVVAASSPATSAPGLTSKIVDPVPTGLTTKIVDPVPSKSKHVVYTTVVTTAFTTYCPEPTKIPVGNMTYTVTKPTTLTITSMLPLEN